MKSFKNVYAATAFALAAFAPAASHAAGLEVLNEGFANVPGLANSGWVQVNNSVPPGIGWFQGNFDIFSAQSGPVDSYVAANFNSARGGIGSVDNWLITPALSLMGDTVLTFSTRAASAGFADLLEVRFAMGDTLDPSAFSLLATIGGAAGYPGDWQQFTARAVASNGVGKFAFRYLGDASALEYIGVDSVRVVTAVPEPSAWLMLCLGLGALTMLRRKLLK